jgi:hypothetical protein
MAALFQSAWDGQDGSNYGWSAVIICEANGTETGGSCGIVVSTMGDDVIPDADIPRLITALQTYIAVQPETAVREPDSDWIRCVPACDNTPDMDGFALCLPDGTEVESGPDGPWDGKLLACNRCGRIINQDTLAVTGRRTEGGT